MTDCAAVYDRAQVRLQETSERCFALRDAPEDQQEAARIAHALARLDFDLAGRALRAARDSQRV